MQGRLGELDAQHGYGSQGYRMVRTGTGSDFKAIPGPLAQNQRERLVECKTGNAVLTPRQIEEREKARRRGQPYDVFRSF
jgi:hypothetical protein